MRRNDVANWYNNKHQSQNIPQYEIERKWRMYLWEEEQRQLAESLALKDQSMNFPHYFSPPGGGGGISPAPFRPARIITENGIFIQTQNSDYLIIE